MAGQAILQIKEAEDRAHEIIKNAQDEANRIIRQAEQDAADAFSRLVETCKREGQEKKQKAEETVREYNLAFSKETEEMCEALKQNLLSRKEKAIDVIIETLTK